MEIRLSQQELAQKFLHLQFPSIVQSLQANIFELDEESRLVLVRSLWELGHDEEAKRHLEELQGSVAKTSDAFLQVLAQWSARQKDISKAERLFQLLLDRSQAAESFVLAKVGLCQLAIAKGDRAQAQVHLNEVNELCDVVHGEISIQIELLRAEFALQVAHDATQVKHHIHTAIRLAAAMGSSYHMAQAVLIQLALATLSHQLDITKSSAELLDALLPESATALRNRMYDLQRELNHPDAKPTMVKFDVERKRVAFNEHWIPFHEKPILFNFLEFLHRRNHFVGKKEIAEFLWPEQPYKARIHDPRLFDIARRLRGIMEECPGNRITLLSGRLGYLLVQDQSQIAAMDQNGATENFSKDVW